jgi:precorrin-6B C5,15-methyltransferase / cobalt-precorrin-6B C5,C15-methyltransferase
VSDSRIAPVTVAGPHQNHTGFLDNPCFRPWHRVMRGCPCRLRCWVVLVVVGVGADGWDGLAPPARDALRQAEVLIGSARQLALVPDNDATKVTWPSPMLPAIPGLLAEHAGRRVCVLASGDPMFFGVGSTLVRLLGAEAVRVIPHPSSVSLACARLGWAVEEVEVVSLVGRPVELLHPAIQPNRRVLVLSADAETPTAVRELLRDRGFESSRLTVLNELGGPGETVGERAGPLNVVAVECRASADALVLSRNPGLPDEVFEHDGQLTKREVRAVTLSALAPLPGELLWDVGAGAGSIGIEWMRTHPSCRAIAVEANTERAARITRNARSLGVPGLSVVAGHAPEALEGLPTPNAIFIGGGLPDVLDTCWAALPPGGRLVANAVTLESETVLTGWQAKAGGTLTRIEISRAAPLGTVTAWRPMLPVTQWFGFK